MWHTAGWTQRAVYQVLRCGCSRIVPSSTATVTRGMPGRPWRCLVSLFTWAALACPGAGFFSPPAHMAANSRGPRRAAHEFRMLRTPTVAGADGSGVHEFERDAHGRSRLAWREGGWCSWTFTRPGSKGASGSFKINYVRHGDQGPPVVLVHGFGASSYHFRYQVAELGKTSRVFAVCLLGHGHSDKGSFDFSHELLGEQVLVCRLACPCLVPHAPRRAVARVLCRLPLLHAAP